MKYKIMISLLITMLMTSAIIIPTVIADHPDQDNGEETNESIIIGPHQNVAQSFIPSMAKLTKIEVYLYRHGNPSGNIVCRIRSSLTENDLTTVAKSVEDCVPTSYTSAWVVFDFSDITVNPGSTYFIYLDGNGLNQGASNYIGWCYNYQGNPYNNGCQWVKYPDTNWEPTVNDDQCFITYGNNPPNKPTNPNPSNGEVGVGITTSLSCVVTDPDSDSMDVTFYWAEDNTVIGTKNNVANGGTASISAGLLQYVKTYSWYVKVSDGDCTTKSDTWTFRTIQEENTNVWVLLVSVSDLSDETWDLDGFNNALWDQYTILSDESLYNIPRNHMRIYASQYETTTPTHIDGSPTTTHVTQGLNWLADHADTDDIVYIFMIDHGSNEAGGKIWFSDGVNNEYMTGPFLNLLLDNINCESMVLVLGHCFSGKFIPICNDANRVILTAADANHPATGMEADWDGDGNFNDAEAPDTVSFSYFASSLALALIGYADFNNNGIVTMQEAYDYVHTIDTIDTPSMGDQGGIADNVYLGVIGNLGPRFNCVITCDADGQTYQTSPVTTTITIKNNALDDIVNGKVVIDIKKKSSGNIIETITKTITVNSGQQTEIPVTWSSLNSGDYEVSVRVYSSDQILYSMKLFKFTIRNNQDNNPPDKPSKPSCVDNYLVTGKSYSFTTRSYDPECDDIYLRFDWGDGTDNDWQGPFLGTATCISVRHTWTSTGSYTIKVQSKDSHDAESPWSDTSTIEIHQKSKATNRPLFLQFLQNFFEKYPNAFPILQKILNNLH